MNQLMKGEPITIFGDGAQPTRFPHISAVAPVMAESVNVSDCAQSSVQCAAPDVPHTVNTIAKSSPGALNKDCNAFHLDPRNEVKNCLLGTIRRAEGSLRSADEGYLCKWDSAYGRLGERAWLAGKQYFRRYRNSKNLPPSWARVLE